MPNSGVFYNGGKFHISKLSTDLVEFAGKVEATGIQLIDEMQTGSSLPNAATSIVLPTATQVVDYIKQQVTGAAEYDLASGSASSGEAEVFSYSAQLADDGAGNVKTEKQRLDDMFAEFADLIAQAASSSETRDNTMQSAIAFIDADGAYLNAKLAATSITKTANQVFSFPAPNGSSLKADMESRFDSIHSALDALAKISEDSDSAIQTELDATQVSVLGADQTNYAPVSVNYISAQSMSENIDDLADALKTEETTRIAEITAIEGSVGLSPAGAYIAPSWAGGALQVWDASANAGVGGFVNYSGAEITAATTVKNADELLRAMIKENNDAFTTLMAGNSVDFDTLKEIVDAYQLADTEVVDAVTKMAARIGLTLSGLNDGIANNEVVTLADLAAVVDGSGNASGRGLAAIAYDAATMPSLKAMVEQSRSDISAHLVAMQTEMDSIETGAGLEANGSYVAPVGVQYLSSATSLKDADIKLDAEIKEVNERLSDKHGTESLLDYTAFDSNGASLPVPAARTADFALSAGYNVVDALNELASFSGSALADLQAELDRTQASVGFDLLGANTDGSDYSPAFAASTNGYFATGASLMAVVADARSAADAAFKGFEGGTGLGKDGVYTANGSANYISTATSLQDADNKLDAAINAETIRAIGEEGRIEGRLDTVRGELWSANSDTFSFAGLTHIANADTFEQAFGKLDAEAVSEANDRIASDTDQLARIGRIITAAGLSSAAGAEGAFVPYTGTLLAGASTMYAADVVLENEILDIAGDLYANPANPFAGFTIAGGSQSTFEEAINALDTLIGDDADLDVAADTGSGAVALATETYSLKGGASADAASSVNIATSWDNGTKEMSIILDANPKAVTFSADEKVQAPIHSSKVKVHDAPMEASDAINAGDIIALDMSGSYTIANGGWAAVKRADKTVTAASDLSKIVGIAFDPQSVNGELAQPLSGTTFSAGAMVAFITEGVIKGFDLSGCTAPAAGQELYLDSAGLVTNSAPSGDGSASTDYVSIHKIGMIIATGASFADNVVMIDMKHLANEA